MIITMLHSIGYAAMTPMLTVRHLNRRKQKMNDTLKKICLSMLLKQSVMILIFLALHFFLFHPILYLIFAWILSVSVYWIAIVVLRIFKVKRETQLSFAKKGYWWVFLLSLMFVPVFMMIIAR